MFRSVFDQYTWEQVGDFLAEVTPRQVEQILEQTLEQSGSLTPLEFLMLISPVAEPYLEQMASLSLSQTRKRFGNTIQLYAPMYLTNTCSNICTYCGFSYSNKIDRIVLNEEEVEREIEVLKKRGYDHVLVVTGEDHRQGGMDYFKKMFALLRKHFSHISLEVQPLEYEDYCELRNEGLDSVLVYQETYREANYKHYHPKGKKSNFNYRLATPDRLGRARIHKMGLGILLGLEDWRIDSFFCALHFDYLRKNYWQTRYSISFPRLRPASGVQFSTEMKKKYLDDKALAQLIFAYRLLDQDLEISISTREHASFRDQMAGLGVTTMSAGSKTNPGGYACYPDTTLKQFEIDDDRSVEEIKSMLMKQGLDPVMKDWSSAFN